MSRLSRGQAHAPTERNRRTTTVFLVLVIVALTALLISLLILR